jgi:glucose-6-phosphate 1-dehydrogenase
MHYLDPIWNRNYIEAMWQITASETVVWVERGVALTMKLCALRSDMYENHILQLICRFYGRALHLIAPMKSVIRKLNVFTCHHETYQEDVILVAVRVQYGDGGWNVRR